jgi:DNA-binding response OmpR family regulator
MPWLKGKRVFVVEDEALISVMVTDMLTDIGITVIGPAATIAAGMRMAESEDMDAAILDVNVRGERIDPVAEALIKRGIPVLFATGYGEVTLASGHVAPVIDKPYTQEKLVRGLAMALGGPQQLKRSAN